MVIFSCSSGGSSDGDGNGNGNGNNQITSITIQSSASAILVGETVSFTVTGNDGSNLTANATIKVDGITIPGTSYTAYQASTLNVTASYSGLTSPAIQVNVDYAELTGITISAASSTYYIGDTIEFTVMGDNSQNLSSDAQISVDGTPISGNTFNATAEGNISVTASYDTFTSNTLDITIAPAPLRFKKNVLVEDYTGTWCGWCPRVAYGIELVEQQTDQAVIVAIHRGNSSGAYYDPFNYPAEALEDMINLGGYPTAMLNRTTEWTYPEPSNVNQVVNLTGDQAELGLAITPTLSGNTMNIDVNVKFGEDYSSSNLKLVVYILEDGLIQDQVNYTSYYGGGSTLVNFEHDHVLRGVLTNILGDAIPSNQTGAEDVYTMSFSTTVPSSVSNSSNISVVAFVVDSSNATINSREAYFGVNQNFEATN